MPAGHKASVGAGFSSQEHYLSLNESTAVQELGVIRLSESFREVWADVCEEIGVRCNDISPNDTPNSNTVAVLLAARGEEDRALDLLLEMPRSSAVPVYVVGAAQSHRFAVSAMRRGAADYFALPDDLALMRRTLASRAETAAGRMRRSGEVAGVEDSFSALVGRSSAIKATIQKAARILHHPDVTVLIHGETGTGKELLARALHDGSRRAEASFVAVNCAAIPANLMESELFGHERGAFTDAHRSKPGLFEEAEGGTLFLDEVGNLPLTLQGKLLRVLEDKKIRRVGGTGSREVDVRVITASHVDLEAAAEKGEFRDDLFYRLNVVTLTLPPLRERGEDVELLAEEFTSSLSKLYGLPVPELTEELRAVLRSHHWPGNVRELRHAIERALLLSAPGTLDAGELIPEVAESSARAARPARSGATLDEIVLEAVAAAVERHGGNKSGAARELGISRARLQRLLDKQS